MTSSGGVGGDGDGYAYSNTSSGGRGGGDYAYDEKQQHGGDYAQYKYVETSTNGPFNFSVPPNGLKCPRWLHRLHELANCVSRRTYTNKQITILGQGCFGVVFRVSTLPDKIVKTQRISDVARNEVQYSGMLYDKVISFEEDGLSHMLLPDRSFESFEAESFFANLTEHLDKLRQLGYQHCDIHETNISPSGLLIDGGLITKIGSKPPALRREFLEFLDDNGCVTEEFDSLCLERVLGRNVVGKVTVVNSEIVLEDDALVRKGLMARSGTYQADKPILMSLTSSFVKLKDGFLDLTDLVSEDVRGEVVDTILVDREVYLKHLQQILEQHDARLYGQIIFNQRRYVRRSPVDPKLMEVDVIVGNSGCNVYCEVVPYRTLEDNRILKWLKSSPHVVETVTRGNEDNY